MMKKEINLNVRDDLLEVLLKIEYSMYSPIAARHGKKGCPYCASFKQHHTECKLNEAILWLIAGRFTLGLKLNIIEILKEIEWSSYHNICPFCQNQKGEGHTDSCGLKLLNKIN